MVITLSNALHPRLGHPLSSYPKFYTNEALANSLEVPVKANQQATSRTIALRSIEEICTLGESVIEPSSYNSIIESITLSKLESILNLTRFPNEYVNFALPTLVAGCIELLSTLIFALNACFLKFGDTLGETIDLMQKAPPGQQVLRFWDQCASLASDEAIFHAMGGKIPEDFESVRRRRWSITCFDQKKFDKLLSILDTDRKNFLIAIRDTRSLGLSTLSFVLKQHVESKKPSMDETEYTEKALLPYCRVFYRYQVVLPDLGFERFASRALFTTDMTGLKDNSLIDMDDSRAILKGYISSIQSPKMGYGGGAIFGDGLPLAFIVSHVVPGCEDLIPDMFESTLQVLWNALSTGCDQENLDFFVRHTMNKFCGILNRLDAQVADSRQIEHSWIFKLCDKIVEKDVVGLILCPTLRKSAPDAEDLDYGWQDLDGWSSTRQFLTLVWFLPLDYLSRRIIKSGALHDWWKYFTHLGALAPGGLQLGPTNLKFSMEGFTAQLIPRICLDLLGTRLEDSVSTFEERGQMCKNPRCPAPFGSALTSSLRTQKAWTDSPYCDWSCMETHCETVSRANVRR
ncbi:dolichyl-diphosphooligosaccharide--protein glycosyltransferase [Rhizoctonia solani]|uniref:Dolichyl-diphosphooligosaccharide--protein glycosyltransferase n=1 Tax=Rhizoctonia solani TaxID=456999 RepID=A0A0K6FUN4_9AGAM|nr:dolichyl-diphosphooligosaccharide--protein glycosyltransferase [Rhizoctonia solani]